jgi:hypothetical protein
MYILHKEVFFMLQFSYFPDFTFVSGGPLQSVKFRFHCIISLGRCAGALKVMHTSVYTRSMHEIHEQESAIAHRQVVEYRESWCKAKWERLRHTH